MKHTVEVVESNPFPKHVEVFGVHVHATAAAPDDKVLHAANVLAEYLDSGEDGVPDNQKIRGCKSYGRSPRGVFHCQRYCPMGSTVLKSLGFKGIRNCVLHWN